MSNFLDVKLVLVDYKPKKVKDLIPGLLALIRDKDEMFFVTEDIIKINKQLEDASGTFVLQDGAGVELVNMYLISDEELCPGDEFIDTKRGLISEFKEIIIGTSRHIELVVCRYEGNYIADDCKKLIARTNQIANAIVEREAYDPHYNYAGGHEGHMVNYPITVDTIKEILGDGGNCSIETEEVFSNGSWTNYETVSAGFIPKLKDGKIVICL